VIRRIAATLAALGLMLLLAAPAMANDLDNGQAGGVPSTSTAYPPGPNDCIGVQPGQVLWHFVHVGAMTMPAGGATLTATFTSGPAKTVDAYQNGGGNIMYNVITGPNTLITASDTIIDNGKLNLSHICDGGPPPDVPEAPASVLLLLTAGLAGLAFIGWKMRTNGANA